MEMTRRAWVGQRKNDEFPDVHNVEVSCGLADDKAYIRSLRTKRAESISVQQIRKLNTIALTGIEVRTNIENMVRNLHQKKADAMMCNDEETLIQIIGDIKLIESLLEVA